MPGAPKTKAIVCHEPTEAGERQWEIEDVEIPALNDDELLVELVASGVCHTDLTCGSLPKDAVGFPLPPYPRVLGHEGAGYVKAIGSAVTVAKPGDAVLLSFAYCATCESCREKRPGYCDSFNPLNFTGATKMFSRAAGDQASGSFFGQSSFANVTAAKESSVVNVSKIVKDKEELKMFAPLGCGFQTGCGTVTHLASATSEDRVAILGLGGVGLTAVMGAKISKCPVIIAVDRIAARLELALELGATHTIDTSKLGDITLEKKVREITEGRGTTITIDATGVPALIEQGMALTAQCGKMILLGVPPMDAILPIHLVSFLVTGKQFLGSMEGGVLPKTYIPQMIEWYREGNFPIDKLIKYFPAEDFKMALHEMEVGSTVKPILLW